MPRKTIGLMLLCLSLGVTTCDGGDRPRVLLVLIDGLGSERVSREETPFLWKHVHEGPDAATFYPQALAAMPAVTNTNHASLATGTYAEAHGIVGNGFWNRQGDRRRQSLDRPELLEVETLFTLAREARKGTAGIFGKGKLVRLFGAFRRQRAPGHLWGDPELDTDLKDGGGLSSDRRVMDEVLRTLRQREPTFLFAALPDVDLMSHMRGPASAEARNEIREADTELGRLVRFLKDHELWGGTVLFVTADHGFDAIDEGHEIRFQREADERGLEGVFAVDNGGVDLVYVEDPSPERIEKVRAVAEDVDHVGRVHVPEPRQGVVGASWKSAHPRIGDLVLVAEPGFLFNDPFREMVSRFRGHHGGPGTRTVPLLVTGGHPAIRDQELADRGAAELPDVGETIRALLGLGDTRRIDGGSVPKRLRGRVLDEAFTALP